MYRQVVVDAAEGRQKENAIKVFNCAEWSIPLTIASELHISPPASFLHSIQTPVLFAPVQVQILTSSLEDSIQVHLMRDYSIILHPIMNSKNPAFKRLTGQKWIDNNGYERESAQWYCDVSSGEFHDLIRMLFAFSISWEFDFTNGLSAAHAAGLNWYDEANLILWALKIVILEAQVTSQHVSIEEEEKMNKFRQQTQMMKKTEEEGLACYVPRGL